MNTRIPLLLLACLTLATPAEARRKKKAKAQPTAAVKTTPEVVRQGLLTVTKAGTEYFFTVPDSLLKREMLVTVRYASTPANTGKFGGEQVNQQTVYFEKSPDGKLLMRSRLLINTADSTNLINRAIRISNEDPIIGSFKIESKANNASKVKVTSFFLEDNTALSLSASAKSLMGVQSLVRESSYIESIKTFPMNTEVRVFKTWTSTQGKTIAARATGKVTLGLNISFVLLPEKPMQRRLFDPRVGYFTDDFTYFTDTQQRVQNKRFITRWRLEPKDSADAEKMKRGELIEPKKPIVYYIDPATPKQWRPYLIQGVNDWQKAFEKAGFKNAIIGKEWPENDSTMSMEDARYSCIRYLASPIENAYGPNVHDPRTGEIIESHICWYHNVMNLVHDWYMIQAGSIDEAAQKMKFDTDLMGQLIRFVSSHEVGHTLGLRHNFGSSSTVPVDSLRSKHFVEKYGHTPSIMDYARFNYVAQPEDGITRAGIFPRINDYDIWAIEWGYRPMLNAFDDESDHYELNKLTTERLKNNPRLWFGDGETNRTNDARCQTEDLGDDAMKASDYGVMNLKRMLKNLPQWTYEGNDIMNETTRNVYDQVYGQFMRYCHHVLRNLGGVYANFKTVNEPGDIYVDEPKEKQQAALEWLDRNVLQEPTWLVDQPYIRRLSATPDHINQRMLVRGVVGPMVMGYRLSMLTQTYPVDEYLPDVVGRIFKEATARTKPSPYRKAIQSEVVTQLIKIYQSETTASYFPAAFAQLRRLQRLCHAASAVDPHFAALANRIDRALAM